MSYNPIPPSSGGTLVGTRDQIRTNFTLIQSNFDINHEDYGVGANAGKHKFMQMPQQSSAPTTAAGDIALYSKLVSSIPRLFLRQESSGTEIQMSGINPSAATNGYTFLPGGLLLQWGIKTPLSSTGTVTFATSNINFPNNCFNVSCTLISSPGGTSSSNTIAPITATVTGNGFNYSYTGSSSYVAFYWQAIGN